MLTRSFATSPAKVIRRRARRCVLGLCGDARWRTGRRRRHSAECGRPDGARALLTTQASTKVYRSLRRSRQSLSAAVDADALLAVLPDPIVCFSEADFVQTQRYDLRGDASLVMVDWITSGRHASGERWAFSRYESRFDIRREPVGFCGRLRARANIDAVSPHGPFDVLLTAVITGPLVNGAAADLERGLETSIRTARM